MAPDSTPCPRENECPEGAPGPVACSETTVRSVPLYEQLVWDEEGKPTLATTFFSKDDLAGANHRTVSVLREELTPTDEVARRAKALNKHVCWCDDPVVARASVNVLRQI